MSNMQISNLVKIYFLLVVFLLLSVDVEEQFALECTYRPNVFQEELHLFVLLVLFCFLFGRPKWKIPANECIWSGCLHCLVSIYAVCCVLSAAVNQTSLVGQRRCELNTQCFCLSDVQKSILHCLSSTCSFTAVTNQATVYDQTIQHLIKSVL